MLPHSHKLSEIVIVFLVSFYAVVKEQSLGEGTCPSSG
jgi:hypothetical protein